MAFSLFKRPRANSLQTPPMPSKRREKESHRHSVQPQVPPPPHHVQHRRPEDQPHHTLRPSRRSSLPPPRRSGGAHETNAHTSRVPHPQPFPLQEQLQFSFTHPPRRASTTVRRHSRPEIMIHPLIRYTPHVATGRPSCPLVWDLRESPRLIQSISNPALSSLELSQHATSPPVYSLSITCGLFPYSWPIRARSEQGISILDIIHAIYMSAQKGVSSAEWDPLSSRQKERIARAFHERCRSSPDPYSEKCRGVRRADCLGGYTRFAGLEIVPSTDAQGVSCVLTLDRVRGEGRNGAVGSI